MKDQEIGSLKERLRLAEVQLAQTQTAISSIQEKLAALSAPPTLSKEDNPTEGEKKAQEKEQESSRKGSYNSGGVYFLCISRRRRNRRTLCFRVCGRGVHWSRG